MFAWLMVIGFWSFLTSVLAVVCWPSQSNPALVILFVSLYLLAGLVCMAFAARAWSIEECTPRALRWSASLLFVKPPLWFVAAWFWSGGDDGAGMGWTMLGAFTSLVDLILAVMALLAQRRSRLTGLVTLGLDGRNHPPRGVPR